MKQRTVHFSNQPITAVHSGTIASSKHGTRKDDRMPFSLVEITEAPAAITADAAVITVVLSFEVAPLGVQSQHSPLLEVCRGVPCRRTGRRDQFLVFWWIFWALPLLLLMLPLLLLLLLPLHPIALLPSCTPAGDLSFQGGYLSVF